MVFRFSATTWTLSKSLCLFSLQPVHQPLIIIDYSNIDEGDTIEECVNSHHDLPKTSCTYIEINREGRRPTHPHDLSVLADTLVNHDSVDQQEVYDYVCDLPGPEPTANAYDQLPKRDITLSSMQSAYNRRDANKAVSRLHQRCRLVIDERFIVDPNDPGYCFSADQSFVDFFMIVGRSIGLDVFLPIQPVPKFTVKLDFRLPIKEFKAKYGVLGFDPSASILYIGSSSAEDLWLGFPPNEYFDGIGTGFRLDDDHKDTRMSTRHYRMVIAFLSHTMTKIPGRDFYMFNKYSIDPDADGPHFGAHSNVMCV
jgi:hypothetical protein